VLFYQTDFDIHDAVANRLIIRGLNMHLPSTKSAYLGGYTVWRRSLAWRQGKGEAGTIIL